MALFASYPISLEYAFGEDFADNYVRSLAANVTYDPLDLTDDVLDYLTIESTILFAFRINCSLLFLFLLLFCQILVLNDILLMVVLLDLCISFLSVLFLLLGGQKHDLMGALFFFLLISLAACETALSLGFLVSFSRRHSTLTSDSLRFLASS
jgi:NADH:ubiquinone oxidoreductase subunit K